jgi:uncharacterized lipoprotein YmbA
MRMSVCSGVLRALLCLLFVAGLLTGCAGKSAPTRFYLLSADDVLPAAVPQETRAVLWLEKVEIPPYLDRPNIVVRGDAGRIYLAEFDYWAEPLRDSISRMLARKLAGDTNRAVVTESYAAGEDRVKIVILRLDASTDGDVTMEAMWRLDSGADTGEWHYFVNRLSAQQNNYSGYVQAHSRLLALLAKDIARNVPAI